MKLFARHSDKPSQAAEWFARLRSGHMTSPDDKAWEEWMADGSDNLQAYENVELAWEISEELRDRPSIKTLLREADLALRRPAVAPMSRGLFGGRVSWRAGAALAAVILVCAVTAVFVVTRVSVTEYASGVGEQRTVTLPDSSTLSLNTGTRVQVRYSRGLRRIDLLAGEAAFAVTHDSERPFEVRALHGATTAVGTEFDVQITGTTATVSVLKGTVLVRPSDALNAATFTQVSAGQAVDYTAEGSTSAIRNADGGKVHGWLAQRIVFSDVTLADALADYNRYTKTPIIIGDPALGERRINGVFRIGDQAAFINALEQGLHVSATPNGPSIMLQPR
jgi:transmembrane sensor